MAIPQSTTGIIKAAVYARVSTLDQEPENQLAELRRYVEARGWNSVEYIDRGVSGAKDRRPALDQLLADAKPPKRSSRRSSSTTIIRTRTARPRRAAVLM
jgi:DNA invertase Pin-like site-specific DNA recombinase